ncbi:MAG: bifunctional proline dehydrogenase/L-glutamate gamma-semialdehyde dehydrogenase PutA [Alphaproteobacteria bacterium]|nr:bifunctional proline dehydrogenase/L-glutamate gamma-semialdehyde dehydrogenase PutA [Alphaproteobacteria bacterium]
MTLAAARARLSPLYLADETALTGQLIAEARFSTAEAQRVDRTARDLVAKIRAGRRDGGIDAFLQEYALTSDEGIALMCLAEALLRVPDADTADKLIKDKIGAADWERHRGQSESSFVNASTWALMLTGKVLRLEDSSAARWTGALRKAVTRSGEPVIRQAMTYAMRIMGGQFVLGRTIKEALNKAKEGTGPLYRYSFDMLGEAAFTREDAARYRAAYEAALDAVAAAAKPGSLADRPSLSVKLSALHPRYEIGRKTQVMDELLLTVASLAGRAKAHGIALTIDAEEADRLELSLDLFEALARDSSLAGWNGLGLAVQAYQKRATAVLDWLRELSEATGRQLPVRLVKGAYWDSEIKRAQELGLSGYPVFTRKQATDVSYLACMRRMLAAGEALYPQFATHNAHTVASALVLGEGRVFEFQRLHGMGAPLYDAIVADKTAPRPCRVYAPVGSHEDLLAYLVRRLLENGANTSFVNRLADDEAPIAEIIADPTAALERLEPKPHPRIALPGAIFGGRANSSGALIADAPVRDALLAEISRATAGPFAARSLIAGREAGGTARAIRNPGRLSEVVGEAFDADPAAVAAAVDAAAEAQDAWNALGGAARAAILERAAGLFERDRARLIGLCIREAGKTLANGLADVREAIDFLRYYAAGARADFAAPHPLPGPTGERNTLGLHGRGVFAAISPWNFPAAIFTGQVAAALAAGNAVVAKPAEQTPLIAAAIVRLLHEAGVPPAALNLVIGDGPTVGAPLSADPRLAGVVFTGSTEVARLINRTLAARDGPIATLIAETGGLNAMIADSTALPEQLVRDALAGAFDSAGQRCSALRVLFVQDGIAGRVIKMLAGAMEELVVGDPMRIETDIGPVIDAEALAVLEAHAARMNVEGKLIARAPLAALDGHFFAPQAFEIDAIGRLKRETFGPILHVVRYKGDRLGAVCEAINATGYGLTLGIHTRIASSAEEIAARVRAGNIYVNRNQIGAVVEAQPFGGEGLSGTGPKAGGPHYLHRFATERTLSVNTTAAGGNASLLSLGDTE